MGNKYREPWADGVYCGVQTLVSKVDSQHIVMSDEVRQHIASCVNACAGMDDPVAEVQRLKNKAQPSMLCPDSTDRLQDDIDFAGAHGMNISLGGQENLQKAVDEPKSNLLDHGDIDPELVRQWSIKFSEKNDYSDMAPEWPPSWHELGIFPPVGTECEIASSTEYLTIGYPEGAKVKIYSHFTDDRGVDLAAFVNSAGTVGGVAIAECFRPIQTEEQKTIKAMRNILGDLVDGAKDIEMVAEEIYDQFIADKKGK